MTRGLTLSRASAGPSAVYGAKQLVEDREIRRWSDVREGVTVFPTVGSGGHGKSGGSFRGPVA
jgi:hypothetical protein